LKRITLCAHILAELQRLYAEGISAVTDCGLCQLAPETLQANLQVNLRGTLGLRDLTDPALFTTASPRGCLAFCKRSSRHVNAALASKRSRVLFDDSPTKFQGTRVIVLVLQALSTVLQATMGSTELPIGLLPSGAWDSHVHVVDEDKFPLHLLHPYRPMKAPISELQSFHRALGIDHACLISFSVYHDDHSSILDALHRMHGKGRAVACINTTTATDDDLRLLHRAGVRGIRLNMRTCSQALDIDAVRLAAARIRPLGWVMQLYISLDQTIELAPIVSELGVTVIIDHIGAPWADQGPGRLQPGYAEFIKLLEEGRIWTKLSGAYRFPNLPDLDEYVTDILRAAPGGVVWASDWPHSGGVEANPDGDRNKVQGYRQVDDVAWISRCKGWCELVDRSGQGQLARKIWVDNPRRLWQYDDDD
jgi:predicted TIM-barrel fold metal-dependent hydrolase